MLSPPERHPVKLSSATQPNIAILDRYGIFYAATWFQSIKHKNMTQIA